MSKKIVRNSTYTMEGQDRTLRLQKWSSRKFFTLVGELADIIDSAAEQSREGFTLEMFLTKLMVIVCKSASQVELVIKESIVELNENEEVLEWDPEDLLGVLDKIFEMNITEAIQKKAKSVLGRVLQGDQSKPQQNSRQTSSAASSAT
jgi:hypothetical protein